MMMGDVMAMEPRAARAWARRLEVAMARGPMVGSDRAPVLEVRGEVAVVHVAGPLLKEPDPVERSLGAVDTVEVREAVREARLEGRIRGIAIRLDSPGGSASGIDDLAEEVRRAAEAKPVVAYAEDLAASAAYWVGCGARRMTGNAAAIVGSIGTYAVMEDSSGAAEAMGVTVHVVSTGMHKGAGEPGTRVLPEHLEQLREVVEALNERFVATVARSRRLGGRRLEAVTDGRVFVGDGAVAMGLMDGVETWEECLGALKREIAGAGGAERGSARGGAAMAPVAAAVELSPEEAAAAFERLAQRQSAGVGMMGGRAMAREAVARARPDLVAIMSRGGFRV